MLFILENATTTKLGPLLEIAEHLEVVIQAQAKSRQEDGKVVPACLAFSSSIPSASI